MNSFTIKRQIKKLQMIILKSAIYLFVLLLIPYFYLVYQAKQGIDAFIVSYPLGGEVEYDWVTINFDGDIYLHNVRFYQSSRDPIFTSHKIKIELGSSFEIFDLKTKVIYKEFPLNLSVNLEHASSEQMNLIPSLFGIEYDPNLVNVFFPPSCQSLTLNSVPYITFEGRINFEIQRTADIAKIDYYFRSKEIASLRGSFLVNSFSNDSDNAGFLSHLKIKANDLVFVQQNTQKCLSGAGIDRDLFSKELVEHMSTLATKNKLSLNENASKTITEFMYIPQSIELNYSLKDGAVFSQIPTTPLNTYQSLTGLDIRLNDLSLGTVFSYFEQPKESKTNNNKVSDHQDIDRQKDIAQKSVAISPYALNKNIGAKLELHLKNGLRIVGYLEKVTEKGILIRQLKFKGESVLPFVLEEISAIQILRMN